MKGLLYFSISVALCLLGRNPASAQYQNEWHFGGWNVGIGLNFNTNPPTIVPTAYTGATGSGTSVTDANGNLLFYTDGSRVWNRNHQLMPNGNGLVITGSCGIGGTAPQRDGMIIQPIPFDSNRYYIFSIPYAQCMDPSGQGIYYPSSLYYSIVDMTLDGTLGDIVPGEKGVLIDQGLSSGGLCIVPGNHCDYWLLAHTYYLSDSPYYLGYNQDPPDTTLRQQGLLAYHITEGGIDMAPVHTVITDPAYLSQDVPSNFIPIVVSHDRSKLLVMNLLGKFDPETGIFSDYFRLFPTANFISYGCQIHNAQFSPNDKKLYVSAVLQDGWGASLYDTYQGVFQFDISQFNYYPIRQSQKMVYSQYSGLPEPNDWRSVGQVRMTPYNEIYFLSRVGGIQDLNHRDQLNSIVNPDADFNNLIVNEDILYIGGPEVAFGWGLNTPVVNQIHIADTQRQMHKLPLACHDQELTIPGNAVNIVWYDSANTSNRTIHNDSIYWVQYQLPAAMCTIYVDSFNVRFSHWDSLRFEASPTCPRVTDGKATAYNPLPADGGITQTFSWYDEEGNNLRATESNTGDSLFMMGAGNYSLHIQLSNGCDTTISFSINAYPFEAITATPQDTTIKYGDTIQLDVTESYLYQWYPASSVSNSSINNPLAFPLAPTRYVVRSVDTNGCWDSAFVKVNIDYSMPDGLPNAFSPNGDGLNDEFKIMGITYQKLLAFKIFNRWGELVFETTNPDKGWDGNFNNKSCDIGVYFYQITLSYPNSKIKNLKGEINLLR